jgi:hypothetical protein
MSIALAWASEDSAWRAGKAADYAHQSTEKVTIGAKAFKSAEETEPAFGKKADFNKFGFMPVLVVVENQHGETLDLKSMQVELVAANGNHVQAMVPDDVPYIAKPGQRPGTQPKLPFPTPKKKNPLAIPELQNRAFSAQMLPNGDSANGFFYFEAKPEPGMKLYLNGLRLRPSGKELFYFEIEL